MMLQLQFNDRVALSSCNRQGKCSRDLQQLKTAKRLYERMDAGFKLYLKSPYKGDRKDKIGLTPELQVFFSGVLDLDETAMLKAKQDAPALT